MKRSEDTCYKHNRGFLFLARLFKPATSLLKVLIFLPCLFCFMPLFSKPLDINLDAKCAILINGDTGKVLYEKNAHYLYYPASLTKIVTALFVLDQISDISHVVKVSKEALRTLSPNEKQGGNFSYPPHLLHSDGSNMGLKEGELIPLKSLMYGLMLASGNDAANVIAEEMGGSIPCFMEEVNHFLKDLGCKNTHLCNPHGLHHPEHVTSAYDMALILKRAFKDPLFRKIVSSTQYQLPKTNCQAARELVQTNKLIRKGKFYYPHAIGGKTGFTSFAKYNLACAAEKNGRFLIAIVLGSPTTDARFKDTAKLFEAAFAEAQIHRTLIKKDRTFVREVEGGTTPLVARLQKDVTLDVFPSEEEEVRAFVHWNESLKLPIKKGDKVGEIRIISQADQSKIRHDALIAEEDLHMNFFAKLKSLLSFEK